MSQDIAKGKILVVEDDNDLRQIYDLILSRAGYEVCSAPNGQKGLEEVTNCEPDLILLDIFMPVMDGKTFLQTADLSGHNNPKVVVYSNTSDNALMREMQALGADKVVNKSSLAPADLIKLVEPYFA